MARRSRKDESDFDRWLRVLTHVAKSRHEYTYTEIADAKIAEAQKELRRLYNRSPRPPRVIIRDRPYSRRAYWQSRAEILLRPRTPQQESAEP